MKAATIPHSFFDYVRSMGPGIVVVMTWMGAGDVVECAMAGGNYGYALMWAFAVCLIVRYLFVSIIAKYQIYNEHGETVLGGLTRLHPLFAPFIFVCTLLLGHGFELFLLIGISQVSGKLSGFENIRVWAIGWCVIAFFIAARPTYRFVEKVFFILTGMLSISLLGLAGWVRPSPEGIVGGIFGFAVPETVGRFDAVFIMVSLIGAVGGALGNLLYPYFIREKGWLTPAHRRVQQYDLIFGIIVLIILDLSIWVVGAEVLHPRGIRVVDLESLARLLGETLGQLGTTLFYLGIFAALFSSLLGIGTAYGYLAADAYIHTRALASHGSEDEMRQHRRYQWLVAWILFSPLLWILLGQSDFVGLTVTINAAQVVIIPVLVVGLWIITAKTSYIGPIHRNRWWENVFIGFLFLLGCAGAYFAVVRFSEMI